MADLNGGKGKFWGVDDNVLYADSFVGATKVAEKVKKGGTEKTPDGYVVDAIDIDWGGLKLTTIGNGWSQHTVSSSVQNAGKGENTQGIHSTAYLLNLISSSFTQIYNQIGGDDNAGLRQKIKTLETSIEQITGSYPGQLVDLRKHIKQIEDELSNPGAAGTMLSILDTLNGFNKDTDNVKEYIDKQDKAILGKPIDAATDNTVYGVRKYVEEKAETSYTNAVTKANEYTNQAIGTAESTLIGASTDAATADTIWGAKNYANTTVKNSLLGATGDQWSTTKQTIWGAKNYADIVQTASYAQAKTEAGNVLGYDGDLWPNRKTVYGVAEYAVEKDGELEKRLIGNTADTSINSHWGVKNSLIGTASDHADSNTIWGAKNYAKVQISVTKYNQLTAQVIEENGEGILNFLTVSSYLG